MLNSLPRTVIATTPPATLSAVGRGPQASPHCETVQVVLAVLADHRPARVFSSAKAGRLRVSRSRVNRPRMFIAGIITSSLGDGCWSVRSQRAKSARSTRWDLSAGRQLDPRGRYWLARG